VTGQYLWRFDVPIVVPAAPSTDGERIYVASGTAGTDPTDPEQTNAGTVYAINRDPVEEQREQILQQLRPKLRERQRILESGENQVGAGGSLNDEIETLQAELDNILSLDASVPEWTAEVGAPVNTKPAVTDETVFVAAANGFIYALDATTGQQRWRHQVVDDESLTSPVVVGDQLYVGSSQGLVALGVKAASGQEADSAEESEADDDDDETGGGDETDDTTESTAGEEQSDGNGNDGSQNSDGSGPGFGLPAGLAALGGAGYLLVSRNVGENVQEGEQEGDADQ
jgi:PGF-CTERM protein